KRGNVVAPKNSLDLRKSSFVEIGSRPRRLEIHTADLDIETVFLRCNHQVSAVGPQFAADLVPDAGRNADHGRRHCRAEGHGYCHQQLASSLSAQGFVNQSHEHRNQRSKTWTFAARSASRMTIKLPSVVDASGIGLHPPGVPTDCGLMGAEQFLQ